MEDLYMSFSRKLALAGLLFLCLQPAQAEAGCGCQKPPPPLAAIRPAFASPGDEVTLFAPGIVEGSVYEVTFRSTAEASVWARAKFRRDFADGIQKPQIVVEVPDLPPGPTSVTVSYGRSVVLRVEEYDFTTLQQPITLAEANLTTMVTCYRAAVGADSTVYIPVDVSAIAERMIFTGMADGYRLMFGGEDIVIYNTQGVLMQLLGPEQAQIFGIYDEGGERSFALIYDRHEFVTYQGEHSHVDGYGLDPSDPEWHTDGTRHVDHDHLVLAIRGLLQGEDLPPPGQTPRFTFAISTLLPDAPDGTPVEPMLVHDNCESAGSPGSQWRHRRRGWGKGGGKGKSGKNAKGGGTGEDAGDEGWGSNDSSDDEVDQSGGNDEVDQSGGNDGAEGGDGNDGAGEGGGDDGVNEDSGEGGVNPEDPGDDPGSDTEQDDGGEDSTTEDGSGDDGADQEEGMLCGATPRMGCRISIEPAKAELLVKDGTSDRGDGLVWKWIKGERTEPADFGSPTTTDSLGLCMYEQSGEGPVLVFRAITAPGSECSVGSTRRSCWLGLGKQVGSGGYGQYTYRNKEQTPDGIDQMVLKPGDEGKVKVLVKAKGGNLSLPELPLGLPLQVQLHAQSGECWEATYSEMGVKDNNPRQFKGTAD